LIRPVGERYQIVSGHHRVAASWKAGLTEVPAVIKEMDDEETYMQLLLCNTQTGLTALERGIHALKCVALSKGGAGNEGGVREYARRVGCSASMVTQLRNAAAVAESSKVLSQLNSSAPSTGVLNELHKLPKEDWKPTLRKAIDQEWTVAKTIDKVKAMRGIKPKVKLEPEIPEPIAEAEPAEVLEINEPVLKKQSPSAASEVIAEVSADAPETMQELCDRKNAELMATPKGKARLKKILAVILNASRPTRLAIYLELKAQFDAEEGVL